MSRQLQTEIYAYIVILKDKTSIKITQEQYDGFIKEWSEGKYRKIYSTFAAMWINTFNIENVLNIAEQKKRREAAYTKLPQEENETQEEKQARMDQMIKTKALVKYMFKGVDKLNKQEKEDAKEYYLNLGREIKSKLEQTYTEKPKEDLEKELEECKNHYTILNK